MINIAEEKIKQIILDINDIRQNILVLIKTDDYNDFKDKQLIYRRDYAPKITEIIQRSEIVLGENNPTIIEAKKEQQSEDINYNDMSGMTESLSSIIVELAFK